jgi:hypothetical protein
MIMTAAILRWRGRPCTTAALAALLLAPAGALSAPRIVGFACKIGSGRGLSLSRLAEADSEDELACHADVIGVRGRSPADLVAELRLLPAQGPFRVVASKALDDDHGIGHTGDVFITHSTWAGTVDWDRPRRPRLRLVLRILDKPPPGARSWRVVAEQRLELGKSAPPPR